MYGLVLVGLVSFLLALWLCQALRLQRQAMHDIMIEKVIEKARQMERVEIEIGWVDLPTFGSVNVAGCYDREKSYLMKPTRFGRN